MSGSAATSPPSSRGALRVVPPGPALRAGVGVTAIVVAVAALAWWVGGGVAALGVVLGVMAGLPAAVASMSIALRAIVVGLAALSLVAGLLTEGHPWLAGIAVLAAALAGGRLGQRSAGLGMMLPVLVALGSSAGLPGHPIELVAWLVAGASAIMVVGRLLGAWREVPGVDRLVARRHALAMGLAGGAATVIAGVFEVRHGYWSVLALAATLRPVAGRTSEAGRNRILGTAIGAALAVVIVLFLPTAAALGTAAVCILLTVSWALAGDELRQNVFATPVVLLVGSSGLASQAVGVALERLVLTSLGIVLAVVMALYVQRVDARQAHEPGTQPAPG